MVSKRLGYRPTRIPEKLRFLQFEKLFVSVFNPLTSKGGGGGLSNGYQAIKMKCSVPVL